MISRRDDKHNDNQYLYCIGTDQSNEISDLVKKADLLFDKCSFDFSLNNSKDPSGIYSRSDQYNFYKRGIPAIQFFSGLHVDYHKSTDTVDKIDFNNLEDRVRLISLVISLLETEGFKN
jgi:Zn-dependent M28 family amino/carboxypeptidase